MPASRIFAFARDSRCAIVGSGTRNARAISAVVSPPNNRSVSASCASGASAGWQQVKIRRSRSSRTSCSSRRSVLEQLHRGFLTLIARGFAPQVVERAIARGGDDPAGRRGRHACCGQRASAVVKASCTASSASAMSPRKRDQDGNGTAVLARGRSVRSPRSVDALEERPHFDRRAGGARQLAPQSSAASRSAALRIVMPPICSLLSMNGPSVVTTSPSWWRSTVAELAGCSPPLKIHTPAACISFCTASTSRMIFCNASGAGCVPPAG